MRFARFVLVVQALIMAGVSLAYWVWPYEMANLNGMLLMENASVSHMRVYYGGLQMGLALFLLWAMGSAERARTALVMLVIIMLALVAGRLGSLWLDGGSLLGFDLASLVYRVLAALLAAAALVVMVERPAAETQAATHVTRRRIDDGPPKPFRVSDEPDALNAATAQQTQAPSRPGDQPTTATADTERPAQPPKPT